MENLNDNDIRVINNKNNNKYDDIIMKILSYFFIILGIAGLLFIFYSKLDRIEKNTKQIMSVVEVNDSLAKYNHLLNEENDILYKYIENIDTFKNINDAYQASEDLFDTIQELYE